MKRSVLLLSTVLLAFGASAQADGIGISYAGASMSMVQFSPCYPSVLVTPYPSLHLVPTMIYGLSPVILLSPAISPHMVVTSPVILLGSPHVQPSFGVTMIGVQSFMATSQQQDASMVIITDVR
jgi:hypothetical protein